MLIHIQDHAVETTGPAESIGQLRIQTRMHDLVRGFIRTGNGVDLRHGNACWNDERFAKASITGKWIVSWNTTIVTYPEMRPIPWKPAKIRIEHQSSTQSIKSFTSTEGHVKTAESMSAVKCLGKQVRCHQIQDILATIGRIHYAR